MKKIFKINYVLIAIIIGLTVAIVSYAFTGPPPGTPPAGNPYFWLLNGTKMYYSADNVGIGTSGPVSKLDVNGGISVGSYAGTNVAPSNGLIVSGGVGIGVVSPTAVLHLKAGTATASTAPLKFTSGPLLGTAEAGTMEFLTDAFYLTKTTGPTREQVVTAPNTLTFTNKRNTPRIYTTPSIAGSPGVLTPEINTYDYFEITAQAAALNIANPSVSTPTGGEKMIIAITSDSSARALTYGTNYVAKGGVALPTTTVASKTTTLGFIYNAGLAKWNLVAVAQE
jgi:hypothetical protein